MKGGRYGKSRPVKSTVVHYLGGGVFVRSPRIRTIRPDWPPCHIPAGQVTGTADPEEVTCKKCQAFLKNWRKKK